MERSVLVLMSAVGPFAMALALVVLGQLSQRLGAVTKMPPHYRWFYVAAGLVGGSVVARLLGVSSVAREVLSLVYSVTFAVGVTLGLVVAWHYWGWLFGERK